MIVSTIELEVSMLHERLNSGSLGSSRINEKRKDVLNLVERVRQQVIEAFKKSISKNQDGSSDEEWSWDDGRGVYPKMPVSSIYMSGALN